MFCFPVFGCRCPNWAILKTKYPVVANMVVKMLNRCFGSAFPESHVGAEPELIRRKHLLGDIQAGNDGGLE